MVKPTERALKRKPAAVILLTTKTADVPKVPDGAGGREFEWFNDVAAAALYFDQNVEFHKEDVKDHGDFAYMAIEVTDTSTEPMQVGRIDAQPDTDKKVAAWVKEISGDITKAFQPVVEPAAKKGGEAKVVRARRKSTAAGVVQNDDKAANLRKRLADKKKATSAAAGEAKSAKQEDATA